MKHLLAILLGCLLPALLPAVETFSVLDFEGEGLNRGRNTFNAETFPHCKPTAAENTNGFRLTAVDMNVNIRKAFQWEKPQLDKEIRMLTCRDEHTFGLFTVFALKDTGKFEISVSDLTGDNGVIPASQLKVLEMIPKGANPRFTYSRSILKPQLENVKAGEMLELLVMVNVDKDVKGGLYRGKLTVRSSNGSQEEMAISLRVAPFILGEYGHFGFYLNGNLYANKPYFNINQKAYVKENLPLYCNFLKSRRFNSLTIYDCLPDLRFVNGKVTGTFDDMSALALAMKRSGMGGMLIIDLRDIGYWCNAVALKLESLGGKAPAGDIGITMQQRRSSTEGYPDKAKELYGEAIKLLMRQAAAEDWPEIRLLADEELGNQFPLKISNYENYMPVIMKVAPELGAVVDNGMGWGRKTCTEYADRDNVKHRQYNSWTDESLAEAKRDGAEVFTFNYSVARINSGFTQIRMNSLGHHQWADLWDASNYQWQMNRLSTAGVVTCLASERMHEGIVDYSACRLLQDLVAKCRAKGLNELAEMGEKTLKDVTADLSVNHNTAQLQGYLMSGANLDARRWEVFCAIAKILDFTGMTGDDRIAAGTTTLTVRKAIRPQPK
ncbi:MAG: hypothetical protein J6S21_02700, partial [Victivallales bacterium]|nr:hypothetical protein [Victivallales bacterium]